MTQSRAAFALGSILALAATQISLPPGDYHRIRASLEQSIAFGRLVPETSSREFKRARVMEVQSLNILGQYFSLSGEKEKATTCYKEALSLCRTLGNVLGEGQICSSLGELLENEGALEQALHYRERALGVYRQVNEPDTLSVGLSNLCGVLTYLGEYQTALQHGRAALQLRQRHGLVNHFLYYRLALAAFHLGDDAQVMQWVTDALEESALSPYTFQFRLLAGECATRQDRWSEADEALQAALAIARTYNISPSVASARRGLADLALAQGDAAAALAHVEGILPLLEAAPPAGSHEPLRLYWTCYRALRANNDPRACGILAAAHALLQSQAALIQDAALRQTFLQQVAANREIVAEWMKIEG